jgi:hypothetical protein
MSKRPSYDGALAAQMAIAFSGAACHERDDRTANVHWQQRAPLAKEAISSAACGHHWHGCKCFSEASRTGGVSQSLQDSRKALIALIDRCVNTGTNDAAACATIVESFGELQYDAVVETR